MKKFRIAYLLISLLLVCSLILTACNSTNTTTQSTETAKPDETKTEKTENTQNNEKPVVTIGGMVPLTGNNAYVGEETSNAIKLYIKQLNDSGELPITLDYVCLDDQGDVTEALTCATKLAEQYKVPCVLGPWLSSQTAATTEYFEKMRIVSISVGAGVDELTQKGYKYYFRTTGNNSMQGQRVPIYLYVARGWKNVIVVYPQSDYGVSILNTVHDVGDRLGMNIIAEFSYELNATDFYSLLSNIKQYEYDGLIMPISNTEELANFTRQAYELGFDLSKLFGVGVDIRRVLELIGEASYGLSSNANFDNIEPTTEAGKKFVESYKETYGSQPSLYACQGRETADALIQAIVIAYNKNGFVDGDGIVEAYENNVFTTMYGKVDCTETHDNFVSFIVQQIVDGKVKTVDTTQYDEYKEYFVIKK